jgi:hypothetical protein
MNLKLHLARAHTRREFFKHSGFGLGALALATLLHRDGFAASNPKSQIGKPSRAEAAALPREGKERHLPAHVRRAAATGFVR